jgi:DNA polymerase-2
LGSSTIAWSSQSSEGTPFDYDHYAETQVLSVARSIAAAAGWDSRIFPHSKNDYLADGQMEFEFSI